ncbi:MAG: S8 family serine peptidase [Candidatus Omnitrophica bacterium]|nr:S8 family serine peptidase [Candidatus Omnitrophota bacterium]
MKRRQNSLIVGVHLLIIMFVAGAAQAQDASVPKYMPDRVIVKFKSEGAYAVEVDAADVINNQRGFRGSMVSPVDSLDALCERHKIRQARNVFLKRQGMTTTAARQVLKDRFQDNYRRRVVAQFNKAGFTNLPSMDQSLQKLPDLSNTYVLECAQGCDVEAMVADFKNDPHVDFAQPDYRASKQFVPNDPLYNTPFNAGSWGQNYPDLWPLKADKMNVEPAWDLTFGAGVVVAVVDTGIDYTHPDLILNVYQNFGEFFNGLDDDGNGFIDDTRGWNFIANTDDPLDGNGHGTHVSGIIAAMGNNGIGTIGVAPQAKVMPLKALDSAGNGNMSDLAEAIYYAADNGADIINGSWMCTAPCPSNPVAEIAVQYAADLGVLMIFAAGNNGDDVRLYSPQNMDESITVSATTETDNFADFSNFGPGVLLAAPGGGDDKATPPLEPTLNITSTISDIASSAFVLGGSLFVIPEYSRQAGTSMAAAHVSGLAALMVAYRTALSPQEILLAMLVSAEDLGIPDNDTLFGFGRVNAAAAMTVPPTVVIAVDQYSVDDTAGGNGDGSLNPGESIHLSVTFSNEWIAATNVDVMLTTADPFLTIDTGTVLLGNLAVAGTLTVDFTFTIDPAAPLNLPVSDFTFLFTHDTGTWNYNLGLLGYVTAPTETIGQSLTNKSHPAVSGDRTVWQDARNGNSDIYLYDAGTGLETQITTDTAEQINPKISGDIIVWQDFRNGNWDVFMYDMALSAEIPLTSDPADQQLPAVDGNRVVWEDYRGGDSEIYVYDITLAQETPVTNDAVFQFNPDIEGDLLVWDENGQIVYYDFLVGTPTLVTNNSALNQDPAVSGDVIVWEIKSPVESIRQYDISQDVTKTVASTSDPQYHPDISGDYIVWQDGRNGKRDIYVAHVKTGLEAQMTNQGDTLIESDHPAVDGLRAAWDIRELQTGETGIQTAAVPDNINVLFGDVNGDGNITSIDASQVARNAVLLITFNAQQIAAGDVNGDGNITSIDASLIARYSVGLITIFPVQQ